MLFTATAERRPNTRERNRPKSPTLKPLRPNLGVLGRGVRDVGPVLRVKVESRSAPLETNRPSTSSVECASLEVPLAFYRSTNEDGHKQQFSTQGRVSATRAALQLCDGGSRKTNFAVAIRGLFAYSGRRENVDADTSFRCGGGLCRAPPRKPIAMTLIGHSKIEKSSNARSSWRGGRGSRQGL